MPLRCSNAGHDVFAFDCEADILVTKGKFKVAFEVQWSCQSQQETSMRQQRYASAAVRGLWLFRQHDFPVDQDIPAFRLALNEASGRFRASFR